MKRRGVGALAVRAAAGAAAGLVGGLPGAPVARAWSEWCDTDPAVVIVTPEGRLVTVYCLIGVYGTREVVAGLLGNLSLRYTAVRAGHRTRVTVTATVPCYPGEAFPTRMKVTMLPAGIGTEHGTATGTCGAAMEVPFFLDVG